MRKTFILLIISSLVIASVATWLFYQSADLKPIDLIHIFSIIILVFFGFFIGYQRVKSIRKGFPAEDELSKQILTKSASISFYASLYLWVIILILKDRLVLDMEEWIGTGILASALIYVASWFIISYRGFSNE